MLASLIASLALMAPPVIVPPQSFKEPGPLRICLKAQLDENGSFSRVNIAQGSGRSKIDREALRFLRVLNVKRISREPIKKHSGYTILRATDANPPTFTLTGLDLKPDCAEAIARLDSGSDAKQGIREPAAD